MFKPGYLNQVKLLLECLPALHSVPVFALKGGTAINFFIQDLPRLSVDLDLTYLPLKPRHESLHEISEGLQYMAVQIRKIISYATVIEKRIKNEVVKLIVSTGEIQIKIEPNLIFRGTLYSAINLEICKTVADIFDITANIKIIAPAELYGSKICAALDRQHPRDLFDIYFLLQKQELDYDIVRAFVIYLAGHNRPMNELLNPNPKNIKNLYNNLFIGMNNKEISLNTLLDTREKLIDLIQRSITKEEKQFLLSMKSGDPDWDILGIPHLRELPALQWKLMNIRKMDKKKHQEAYIKLDKILNL